jgi:hypothetical protein
LNDRYREGTSNTNAKNIIWPVPLLG